MSILILTTGGRDPIDALNTVLDILLAEEDGAACPLCGVRNPHCHTMHKAALA